MVKVLFRLAGFAVGLALFLCSIAASAQTDPKRMDAAVMWDEYGKVGGCDHSARLDNLAIALQNNHNLEGYIAYYGPESVSKLTLGIIRDYLVNTRGLAEERFKTIYAGPNSDPSEPRVQLWLAPPGAPAPDLARYENKVETFNGLFDEHQRWDGSYLSGGDEAPGVPMPGVSFPTFVDMLKQRKDTVAYIVAFSGTKAAPGAWRRLAQEESERLQSHGVMSGRVRTIYGGSDKVSELTKIQLWILPADAPPPIADAGPEPPPGTALEIGTYGDYGFGGLGDEERERWAFEVILGALRAGSDLQVCIIVRLQQSEEPEEVNAGTTPPVAEVTTLPNEISDPQPADLLKLVEEWKTELALKYKIRDRLVVLFAAAREDQGNSLETWVVPPGALLPDPDAEPEEASEDPKPVQPVAPIAAATDKGSVQSEAGKSDEVKTQPDQVQPKKKQ